MCVCVGAGGGGGDTASPFTVKWLQKQEVESESFIAIPEARLEQTRRPGGSRTCSSETAFQPSDARSCGCPWEPACWSRSCLPVTNGQQREPVSSNQENPPEPRRGTYGLPRAAALSHSSSQSTPACVCAGKGKSLIPDSSG